MRQLNGQDAAFLYLESDGAHLHLTALYVYEQPPPPHRPLRFAQIARHIGSRLDRSPVLRQKILRPPLNLDYPYWVDDPHFDPGQHLFRHDGAAPRSRRQLFDTVANLHAQPLDLSRPPWEMHIIEKLGHIKGLPGNCFAIIAKYHHAAIDGASGTQLVEALHEAQAGELADDAPATTGASREPGLFELLLRASVNNVGTQLKLAKSLATAVPGWLKSVIQPDAAGADKAGAVPATRFNAAVEAERVFWATAIEARKVEAIRRALPGVTVNDVFLAVCGGALRLLLENLGELPAESLVAMVPVNVRAHGEQALTGNRLSMMFLPVHTELGGAVDRLHAIHRATRRAKSAGSGMGAPELHEISSHIPALPLAAASRLLTSLGLGHRLGRLCNCTITNVPPQRSILYLGPARLVYSVGSAPIIDGMGLIISVFSYAGEFTLSFTSCPGMLPNPELLAAHCQEALDDLHREALQLN